MVTGSFQYAEMEYSMAGEKIQSSPSDMSFVGFKCDVAEVCNLSFGLCFLWTHSCESAPRVFVAVPAFYVAHLHPAPSLRHVGHTAKQSSRPIQKHGVPQSGVDPPLVLFVRADIFMLLCVDSYVHTYLCCCGLTHPSYSSYVQPYSLLCVDDALSARAVQRR